MENCRSVEVIRRKKSMSLALWHSSWMTCKNSRTLKNAYSQNDGKKTSVLNETHGSSNSLSCSQPVSNTVLHPMTHSIELLLQLRLQFHTIMSVYTKVTKLKLTVHHCLPLNLRRKNINFSHSDHGMSARNASPSSSFQTSLHLPRTYWKRGNPSK